MVSYINYLNIPTKVAIVIVAVFLVMQLIGELLEFKGKVVPEFVKIRKVFTRKKQERETMKEVSNTLADVKKSLGEINAHYSADNIRMRDEWIKNVNQKLDQNDILIKELGNKLDRNNQDTLSLLIDSKRNAIISYASVVIDENAPVTREQFKRIFKIYEEYEEIIESNGLKNGEVDVAIRIIQESYETHMRNHTFIEDIRGYTPVV